VKEVIFRNIEQSHPFTYLADSRREVRIREKAVKMIEDKTKVDSFLNLLRYYKAENLENLMEVAKVFNKRSMVEIITALCLHCTENRDRIIVEEELSFRIINLLRETIQRTFQRVSGWTIYTFHPDDVDFLAEEDLLEIVLPSIISKGCSFSKKEIERHWRMTAKIVKCVSVDIKTNLLPLQVLYNDSLPQAKKEAERREKLMYEKLEKNPPAIFQFLSSEREKKERIRKEAIVYLCLTRKYGGQGIYLGLEVHGGYWRAGNLWKWEDRFFPLLWAHPAITQHWGKWAEKYKPLSQYEEFVML